MKNLRLTSTEITELLKHSKALYLLEVPVDEIEAVLPIELRLTELKKAYGHRLKTLRHLLFFISRYSLSHRGEETRQRCLRWVRSFVYARLRSETQRDSVEQGDGSKRLRDLTVRESIERWACFHGVADLLDVPIHRLLALPDEARKKIGDDPVADLLEARLPKVNGLERFRAQVIDVLESEAELAREETKALELRQQGHRPPESLALRELWRTVKALRGAYSQQVSAAPDCIQNMKVSVRPNKKYPAQPGLEAQAVIPGLACVFWSEEPRVWIEAEPDPETSETRWCLNCSCPGGQHRACATRRGALEGFLDVLAHPENEALASQLAGRMGSPLWSQQMEELLSLFDPQPARVNVNDQLMSFGWRVEARDEGLRLVPICVRDKKRGEGVLSRSIGSKEARRLFASSLGHHDSVLLAELEGSNYQSYWARTLQGAQRTHHQIVSLAGRDDVYLYSKGTVPLRIVSSDVVVQVMSEAEDGLCFALTVGDRRFPVEQVEAWLDELKGEPGLVYELLDDALQFYHFSGKTLAQWERVQRLPERLPPEAVGPLLAHLSSSTSELRLSHELKGDSRDPEPDMVLRLGFFAQALSISLNARPLAVGPGVIPGIGQAIVYGLDGAEPCHCDRDLLGELEAAEHLTRQLSLDDATIDEAPEAPAVVSTEAVGDWSWKIKGLEDALGFVERAKALVEQRPRLLIQWDTQQATVVSTLDASALELSLTEIGGWFQVGGAVELEEGIIPLADLLAAARDRQRFIALDDGRWVRLEASLVQHLKTLDKLVGESGKLSPLAAPVISEMAELGVTITGPQQWLDAVDRIKRAATLKPRLSKFFEGTLRPYQREGFAWLSRLALWAPGACLADDMGLGKTIQALAFLTRRATEGPALVVAPTSVGFNWQREAQTFSPGLRITLLRSGREVGEARKPRSRDLYVTSYDLLARHIDYFSQTEWRTLVFDEAQALKNPKSQRALAAIELSADFRLALTGTPLENRTRELWSLFRVIAPGLLGTLKEFDARFALPIERFDDDAARRVLAALIRPFILRRLKGAVAKDLPGRIDKRVDVDFSSAERTLYERVRASALDAIGRGDDPKLRFQLLAAITRLRQLACHPKLFDPKSPIASSKLKTLRRLVRELKAEGHRVLIFSQFTSHLALVREALEADEVACAYLDGSLSGRQRQIVVDAFQRGEHDAFLLSIKAGGTGLNLTAASYVIHLDPWWNPAVEDQATDRAHRIGQRSSVTVIRLVSVGTIEESIYTLHEKKRALLDSVLSGAGSAAALTPEELRRLIELSAE